jgi:serine/threonine protein kinase
MCAPNDVWSLGVILVNLTCGRNPWKQASFQDSTYRAYVRSQDFLKTILPLTDELNDILGRIFNPNPDHRVTLSELRNRIIACSQFTVPAAPSMATMPTPASTQDQYVSNEDAIVDDYDCDSPLSPVSTSSNEGSLVSSVSTLDDLDNEEEDEDYMSDQQELPQEYLPHTYEPDELAEQQPVYHGHEFVPQQYTGPVPVSLHSPLVPMPVVAAPLAHMPCQQVPVPIQAPIPVQPPCAPKSFFPLWEVVKYVQQVPMMQHPVPFHQQVSFLSSLHGCY